MRHWMGWILGCAVLMVVLMGCKSKQPETPPTGLTPPGAPAPGPLTPATEPAAPAAEPATTTPEAPAPPAAPAPSTSAAPAAGQEGIQTVGGQQGGPGTGAISGQALYQGPPRPQRSVSMAGDAQCAQLHGGQPAAADDFVAGPGGELKWTFVYVREGLSGSYPAPAAPVVLDQQGCTYQPHVFGVMVGQPLEIRNSDPLLHNVHALPKTNRSFNIAQPVQNMTNTQTFAQPEIMIPIKCDVHSWMQTFCGVVAHPFFAVTGSDGRYTIQGLPAGTYTLEFWHEKFDQGGHTVTVTVQAGATATANYTFSR